MTGLAKSTVSAVINNRPGVSPETKKRVLEIIERVNYIPNQMAQGLSNQSSYTIGMIIRDVTNPFYAKIFRAVEKKAGEFNFSVLLSNTDGDADKELQSMRFMIAKRVDGIILDLSTNSIESLLEVKRSHIPFAAFGAAAGKFEVDCVEADDTAGAFQAVDHLIANGHRNIMFAGGRQDSVYTQRRLAGIKDALLAHGIMIQENSFLYGFENMADGYRAGKQMLERGKLPTALVAYNDLVAIGIIKALAESGLKVPEDLSIIGFDDIDLVTFPLTTVAIPEYEMGTKVAELLFNRMQQKTEAEPVSSIVLETRLVIRDSVKRLL